MRLMAVSYTHLDVYKRQLLVRVTRSLVTRATLWQTRAMPRSDSKKSPPNGSALGFEATLWSAAEKLKGNMDAGEYKHVVLGLIFLKYISDSFEERHAALAKDKSADAEDRDEYTADNIFWVNKIARWSYLQGRAKPVSYTHLDVYKRQTCNCMSPN